MGAAVSRMSKTLFLMVFSAGLAEAYVKASGLFIVSEDISGQLGSYGDAHVHTPRFDRFAATGVRYTLGYVPDSVCSPSRAVFLTGIYTRQASHIGLATHKFAMYEDFYAMLAFENLGKTFRRWSMKIG